MNTQLPKQITKLVGEVVAHKTLKTAIVKVSSVKVHPKYHKRFTVTKKYMVHDENDAYKVGEKVEIVPCRPMSRQKRFVITRKI